MKIKKIKKYFIMLAAILAIICSSGMLAQAQTVEMAEKGVSVWIPDRFINAFNMDTCKRFEYQNPDEDGKGSKLDKRSEIRIEIVKDRKSVEELMQDKAKWAFEPSDIIGQQSFKDSTGNDAAYVLYNQNYINSSKIIGYVFVNLDDQSKLMVNVSMLKSDSSQQEFNDIMRAINISKPDHTSDNNSGTTKEEHHGFGIDFKIGIW